MNPCCESRIRMVRESSTASPTRFNLGPPRLSAVRLVRLLVNGSLSSETINWLSPEFIERSPYDIVKIA
jgi:hypothetical protein